MSGSGDWQDYRSDPYQSLFTSLHVAIEEGQEFVNHGYKRNFREHVVGVV